MRAANVPSSECIPTGASAMQYLLVSSPKAHMGLIQNKYNDILHPTHEL